MCMFTTVPVSSQTAKKGSQYPEWIDGSPRYVGISLNVTARTPRSALRRISATARSMSHSGMRHSGMSLPPLSPHHSSTIQSLYARTQASPTSLSLASAKVCPQKRGKVGKQSEPSTWFMSMSSSRAFGSQQPRRICSRVIPSSVISSREKPTAAMMRLYGKSSPSYSHQSVIWPSGSVVNRYFPPTYWRSPIPAVSGFGPLSRYFAGSHVSKRCAGSIT